MILIGTTRGWYFLWSVASGAPISGPLSGAQVRERYSHAPSILGTTNVDDALQAADQHGVSSGQSLEDLLRHCRCSGVPRTITEAELWSILTSEDRSCTPPPRARQEEAIHVDLDDLDQRARDCLARAEAAEEGPWTVLEGTHNVSGDVYCDGIKGPSGIDIVETDNGNYNPDIDTARFIAAAREDVPFLANAVLGLTRRVRDLTARRRS